MVIAMRIGIDLHNLSTREDVSIRTGIQQVVASILRAQHRLRQEYRERNVEILPLPMLPLAFSTPVPSHVNNSTLVLREFAAETGVPTPELWNAALDASERNWTDDEFYERCAGLDWLVITGLCDFDHVISRLKARHPALKVAVLVYDLGPIRRPELVAGGMSAWFESRYLESIKRHANLVFTISRHTGLDCVEYVRQWPAFSAPIVSVPLPAEVPALTAVDEERVNAWLKRHGLRRGKFFVAIGTIEPRKNLGSAILGFHRFCSLDPLTTEDFRFVIVGKQGWNSEDERLLSFIGDQTKRFVFPGYLSREDVEIAIMASSGLIMPSRLEGFGLPLALADAMTTPTVTCNNTSLPEATAVSSLFVPADGIDQMSLAFWRLATTHQARALPSNQELAALGSKLTLAWDQLLRDWLTSIGDLSGKAA